MKKKELRALADQMHACLKILTEQQYEHRYEHSFPQPCCYDVIYEYEKAKRDD